AGKIVSWGGNFAIDGSARSQIARLNTDGTIDTSFTYCNCLPVGSVAMQQDGRLLVGGYENSHAKMIRLNPDGSQDASFVSNFTADTGFTGSSASIVTLQPDGRILASVNGGYCCGYHGRILTRLNVDGSTDPGFTSIVYDSGRLISTALTGLVVDPASGKFYMATITYSGTSFGTALKRFNSDGTPDSGWETPSISPSSGTSILGLALQSDGALLVAGRFDSVNGASKRDIVRLMPAGNVDLSFTAPVQGVSAGQLQVLPSGKILVGYNGGGGGSTLSRLNTDGSLDNSFAMSSAVEAVYNRWVLDAAGRILFLGLSEQLEYRYFRLNPNGDIDSAFNPNVGLVGKIYTLARQADGKILAAGIFTQVNGLSRSSLVRLNVDGTLDMSLDVGDGFNLPPTYLFPLSDGKLIAAGGFATFKGIQRPGIARITTDGTLDLTFSPTLSDFSAVTGAAMQSDGKILIIGNFTSVGGMSRTGVARLNADGTVDNTFNPVFSGGSF